MKLDLLNLKAFDEPGLRRLDQWSRQLIQALTNTTREIKDVSLNPTTQLPFTFVSNLNPETVTIVRCNSETAPQVTFRASEPCTWRADGKKVTILSIPGLPNDSFRIILEIRSEL